MICSAQTRQKSWLATLLAFLLVTILASAPAHAQMLMNGAGATFPYPIYSKWFDEYAKVEPSVRINYQSIGSGGGIRQISERTVDFGASDGPMSEEQLKKVRRSCFTSRRCWVLTSPRITCRAIPSFDSPAKFSLISFSARSRSGTTTASRH